jgi:hemin uptake protein HemP
MTKSPPQSASDQVEPHRPAALPSVSSADLLGGGREILIQHGKEQYRLRLTNSNKLILVK